ncbi:hypothetical protein K2Y11_13290 [bacterium]|nr:hypothetical protein [bacterium]
MKFWLTVCFGIIVISAFSTALVIWNPDTFKGGNKGPTVKKPIPRNPDEKPPEIQVDQILIDLPDVKQFTSGETRFPVKNVGEGELNLRLGSKSCTCAAVRLEKDGKVLSRFAKTKEMEDRQKTLHPEQDPKKRDHISEAVDGQGNVNPSAIITLKTGESADYVIEWDTKDQVGIKQIGGDIFTNDPNKKNVSFDVRLHVQASLMMNPTHVNFGQLRENQLREETLSIYSPTREDLQVEFLSSTNPSISATLRPMTDEEKERKKAKSGFEVTVTANGKLPFGDLQQKLQFKTNIEGQKELVVLVTGFVDGLIEVHPDKARFDLIRGPGNHSKKLSISTRGLPPEETLSVDEKRIHFLDVDGKTIQADFIGATIRRHEDSKQLWILEVFVKPDRPQGKFQGFVPVFDSKGEIQLNVAFEGTVADSEAK